MQGTTTTLTTSQVIAEILVLAGILAALIYVTLRELRKKDERKQ